MRARAVGPSEGFLPGYPQVNLLSTVWFSLED
jgi:hypothetical protein